MRIYLDLCVFKRTFDYQGQERIALETSMFIYILERIETGAYELVISDVLIYENKKDPDVDRKTRVSSYFNLAKEVIEIDAKAIERAVILEGMGFSAIDALHIAVAEKANVDYFVTCDDEIVKLYKKSAGRIAVCIKSLGEFIAQEVS